jgi:hypothetical protein
MEGITENSLNGYLGNSEHTSNRERRPNRLLGGGLICLISGALAPVFGSLLTAMSWLIGRNNIGYWFHRLGSVFLISTIPLLIITAFCLDAYEKRGNRIDIYW